MAHETQHFRQNLRRPFLRFCVRDMGWACALDLFGGCLQSFGLLSAVVKQEGKSTSKSKHAFCLLHNPDLSTLPTLSVWITKAPSAIAVTLSNLSVSLSGRRHL